MVIKNYLSFKQMQKERIFDTRVCMQLLKPESIAHYELSLNKDEIKND